MWCAGSSSLTRGQTQPTPPQYTHTYWALGLNHCASKETPVNSFSAFCISNWKIVDLFKYLFPFVPSLLFPRLHFNTLLTGEVLTPQVLVSARIPWSIMCCAVCAALLSCSVMSEALQPNGLQPAGLPCPWGFSKQEY